MLTEAPPGAGAGLAPSPDMARPLNASLRLQRRRSILVLTMRGRTQDADAGTDKVLSPSLGALMAPTMPFLQCGPWAQKYQIGVFAVTSMVHAGNSVASFVTGTKPESNPTACEYGRGAVRTGGLPVCTPRAYIDGRVLEKLAWVCERRLGHRVVCGLEDVRDLRERVKNGHKQALAAHTQSDHHHPQSLRLRRRASLAGT